MIAVMWSVTASRSVASSSRSTRLTAEIIASSRSVLRSSLDVGEFDRPRREVPEHRLHLGKAGDVQSEFEAVVFEASVGSHAWSWGRSIGDIEQPSESDGVLHRITESLATGADHVGLGSLTHGTLPL